MKGQGNAKDKKYIFLTWWNRLAGQTLDDPPQPTPEYNFARAWKRRFRFDWCFVAEKIAVEVDGGNFLVRQGVAIGHHTTASDYDKLNCAAALGWRIFRFTPRMLENDPAACISLVAQALKEIIK